MERWKIVALRWNTQVGQHAAQQIARVAFGLEQESRARGAPQRFKQAEQQRRLSHSRLGNHRRKSTPGFDRVNQRSQRLAVPRTEIQKTGIGSHSERLFSQVVVFKEHFVARRDAPGANARARPSLRQFRLPRIYPAFPPITPRGKHPSTARLHLPAPPGGQILCGRHPRPSNKDAARRVKGFLRLDGSREFPPAEFRRAYLRWSSRWCALPALKAPGFAVPTRR